MRNSEKHHNKYQMSSVLNFKNLKKDDYGGIKIISDYNNSGWFVCFSRIDNEVYQGVHGLDFKIDEIIGNLIILNSDNYVDYLDILIHENNEKSSLECFWKYRGEARFKKLICKLNFNLKIIEFGEYEEFACDYETKKLTKPNPINFSNLIEFLREIDGFVFYDNFEGY